MLLLLLSLRLSSVLTLACFIAVFLDVALLSSLLFSSQHSAPTTFILFRGGEKGLR